MYDFKNDYALGKVSFEPFLTAPNPSASPDPNAPTPVTPAQTPSTSPTPNPPLTLTEFTTIIGIAIVASVLGAGIGFLIYSSKENNL